MPRFADLKRNGMIAVFEIQLRYSEVEGRTAVAGQLRTTIEAIRNPKVAPAFGAIVQDQG